MRITGLNLAESSTESSPASSNDDENILYFNWDRKPDPLSDTDMCPWSLNTVSEHFDVFYEHVLNPSPHTPPGPTPYPDQTNEQ